MEEVVLISLYDYLGYAAGSELGAKVYQAATKAKQQVQTREVHTKTYTGKVMLYKKQFLKEYFESQQL